MELEAIYENGKLHFDPKVKINVSKIPVKVIIDDAAVEEINSESMDISEPSPKMSDILMRIRATLGSNYQYIPTGKTDKELLSEALVDKYEK